ncbi:MAG: hypothetical protein AB4040_02955 [Synechococcus sp.]
MQWSADDFEKEIRACNFFREKSYKFVEREVDKPGTKFERYIFRLENSSADRSIKITFFPSQFPGKPSISSVYISNLSTGEWFDIEHYIKQYHGIEINPEGFRYSSYSGTFEEKVRGFLDFSTRLLEKYAKPTLQGTEWPEVEFDWKGYK